MQFLHEHGKNQMHEDEQNITTIYRHHNDQQQARHDLDLICMNSGIVTENLLESTSVVSTGSQPEGKSDQATGYECNAVDQAFNCFRVQFEHLLSGQCIYSFKDLGVSRHDFNDFHLRYANAAFLCRENKCPRSLKNFDHVKERDRHEQEHRQQFRCPERGCDYCRPQSPLLLN